METGKELELYGWGTTAKNYYYKVNFVRCISTNQILAGIIASDEDEIPEGYKLITQARLYHPAWNIPPSAQDVADEAIDRYQQLS